MEKIKITDVEEMWGTHDAQIGILTKDGKIHFAITVVVNGEYFIL